MPIASGVITIHTGTHAGIPAGWTRETALDTYYIKSVPNNSTQGGTASGASQHTHGASGSHNHGAANHSHSNQSSGAGGGGSQGPVGSTSAAASHGHTLGYGFNGEASTAFNSDTWTSNNDPAFYTVIFIKSDGSPAGFPNASVALWNSSALPAGWRLCDGAGGAPSMGDRFLKGAATATDAGAIGGSAVHAAGGSGHGHGGSGSHSHGIIEISGGATRGNGATADSVVDGGHAHSWGSTTSATSSYGGGGGGAQSNDSSDPPFRKALFVQNNSGAANLPKDIIGMWLGTPAAVPVGWLICDGGSGTPNLLATYPKGGTTTSDFGGTGGVSSHNHGGSGAVNHSHGMDDHGHGTVDTYSSLATGGVYSSPGGPNGLAGTHSHSNAGTSGGSGGAGSGGGTSSGSATVASEPVNKTVMFIANQVAGGSFFIFSD